MNSITISIESCVRYFEEYQKRNDFLTFQVRLSKDVSRDKGLFSVDVKHNEQVLNILSQELKISDKHITFFNSHEDPIVCDEKYIYLSLHIPTELLPQQFNSLEISLSGLGEADFKEEFTNLSSTDLHAPLNSFIDVESATIFTYKDTVLTLHLGDRQGKYTEETFVLRNDDFFCFEKYLSKFSYIGVQCSYENKTPEIEEKHIVKGQKGIYETGILRDEDGAIIAQGLLPFNHRFLNQYYSNSRSLYGFKEVHSVDDVINYHLENPICYFESSLNFLLPQYLNRNTYSQAKLFKAGKVGKSHLNLKVCKDCCCNTECIQVIPSGLSQELMRKNLTLKNNKDCKIYQLIKEKKA